MRITFLCFFIGISLLGCKHETNKASTFSEQKAVEAPISKRSMNVLTAVYPNEGGYTPGDAYDFYYTDDYIIHEWVFRESNQSEPSIITTWEDIMDLEGMRFTRSHKDSLGGFHLYFSNLSIK
jgi:hypothetical protein